MRELLFSVKATDCKFTYTRGTGPGGQKRNKTSSAVHCVHEPSSARSYSDSTRSQHDNKRDAFLKLIETPEFKRWHKLETMKHLGVLAEIEQKIDRELFFNTKTEVLEDGKWIEKEIRYD